MITAAVARASQACWTKWENSLCSRRTYYVDGAGGCGDAHQAGSISNWAGSVKRIVLLARLLSLTYCRTVLHMVRCTAASWS